MKFLIIAFALAVSSAYVYGQCTTPAPTPDPFDLPAGPINFTFNDGNIDVVVFGHGSVHEGATAEGHSLISPDIAYNAITQVISFKVPISTIKISGHGVNAFGSINPLPFRPVTIPTGHFKAKGAFAASVTNVQIEGTVAILVNLITNRVTCRSVNIPVFRFDNVAVSFDEFIASGEQVDWPAWNSAFKANFDADWAAGRANIQERIKALLTDWLKDKTLAQLLAILFPPANPCKVQ